MVLTSSNHREEYLKRKRTTRIIRISFFFFCVVVLVALSSLITHLNSIRITSVELSGGILVTYDDVKKEVDKTLSGSYVFLYPRNNAFIYPHDELVLNLRNDLKRIDTLSVELKNFHTLSIAITERKPVGLWCSGEIPTPSDHCYFMDDASTIFADAPIFSGDAYFKYYGALSTTTPDGKILGNHYMSSSTIFSGISQFVSTVRDFNLHPQYLLPKDNGEFTLILGNGGKIYFDTKEPLNQVSENLRVLLRAPIFTPTSTSTASIDYIDLRFGNKLYYKLK